MSPFDLNVCFHDFPAAIIFESKLPSAAVAVCSTMSLLIQVTVSPGLIVRVAGAKTIPSIFTVCVRGLRVLFCMAPALALLASSTRPARKARRVTGLLGQGGLDVLRVFVMRDERGTHLDEQCLQLRI